MHWSACRRKQAARRRTNECCLVVEPAGLQTYQHEEIQSCKRLGPVSHFVASTCREKNLKVKRHDICQRKCCHGKVAKEWGNWKWTKNTYNLIESKLSSCAAILRRRWQPSRFTISWLVHNFISNALALYPRAIHVRLTLWLAPNQSKQWTLCSAFARASWKKIPALLRAAKHQTTCSKCYKMMGFPCVSKHQARYPSIYINSCIHNYPYISIARATKWWGPLVSKQQTRYPPIYIYKDL